MPRRPRKLLGDGTYHVTARGVARALIYRDEQDYVAFARLFGEVVDRFRWTCHAFCLMPNHYHLVVATRLKGLSKGLHRLNGLYAQRFNKRYDRPGHLFQNRFDARVIEGDRHLRTVCEYVLENPVRAGLCVEADDWPWSGEATSRW